MKKQIILVAIGLSLTVTACGSDSKTEGEEISPVTTRAGLSKNTREISDRIASSAGFLDNVRILETLANSGALNFGGVELSDCVGCDPIEPEPISVDFGLDEFDQTGEEIAQLLESAVFADENVESSSGASITYLIPGSSICDGDEGCADLVDAVEIRVRVTSPSAGNYDLDFLIGPDLDNPFSSSLYTDLLAFEVDLAGTKAALEHLQDIGLEIDSSELPGTMEGRMRAEIRVEGENKIAAAISVIAAIDVSDGLFGLQLAESDPTFQITIDGDDQTVEVLSNVGELDVQAQLSDEAAGTQNLDVHVGGSSWTLLLDAASDVVSITNIGLGDTTTTASLDGNEFLAVDLNKDDGRRFDATLSVGSEDEVVVEISPAFDLSVALKLAQAGDAFGEIAAWMMDEVVTITLDGASRPRITSDENGIKVLDGQLTIGLVNAGITHTVTAGQCLLETDGGDSFEDANPFENVASGTCE